MPDIKNMSFSDKDLGGSRPTSEKVSEVGVVEGLSQPKHSILERCLSYVRLDSGNDMSAAGRWSNSGQSFLIHSFWRKFSNSIQILIRHRLTSNYGGLTTVRSNSFIRKD